MTFTLIVLVAVIAVIILAFVTSTAYDWRKLYNDKNHL